MKNILFAITILLGVYASAQNDAYGPKIPSILPPSPDAAAIVRGGELNVGLLNGAANASIPMHEIKVGSVSIPVGLSYSSNGLKLDELPSRVGLSWNLTCSGVITRSVHDLADDDEDVERFTPMPGGLTPTQQHDYYNELVTNTGIDSEPDEFFVAAPGLQFRFILDDAGVPILFPYSKIKVEVLKESGGNFYEQIIVTNTNGVKYEFGKAAGLGGTSYELTFDMEPSSGSPITRTAFYLRRITLPEGQTIDFTYSSHMIQYSAGVAQSVTRGAGTTAEHCPCDNPTTCMSPMASLEKVVTSVTQVQTTVPTLTSISTSDGQLVTFDYEDVPPANEDKRVASITFDCGQVQKKYTLTYATPATESGSGTGYAGATSEKDNLTEMRRFFLTGVKWATTDAPAQTIGAYKMDYNNYEGLPRRLSFCQDVLGFYNGAGNTTFFPTVIGEETYYEPVNPGNDRGFHGEAASRGMLTKITYPTGGSDSLLYEANTEATWGEIGTTLTTLTMQEDGVDSSGMAVWRDYFSSDINLGREQAISGYLTTSLNPLCTGTCTFPSTPHIYISAYLTLINNTTGEQLQLANARKLNDPNPSSFSEIIPPGSYKLYLRVRGLTVRAYAAFAFDSSANPGSVFDWVNIEAGGVRVKQINSFDPVTATTNKRYYTYADKSLLGKSSGVPTTKNPEQENGYYKLECPANADPDCQQGQFDPIVCQTKTLTTSSMSPLVAGAASNIMYASVIESNHPSFLNGGVQHNFNTDVWYTINVIHGDQIQSVPTTTTSTLQGYELETDYFDSAKVTVKKIINSYEKSPTDSLEKTYAAHAFRLKYDPTQFFSSADPLDAFEETVYMHRGGWFRAAETVQEEHGAGTTLTTSQHFYYNETGIHTPPIETTTTDSKGNTISTETTYPSDFSTPSIFPTMVGRNMLDLPVEVVQKENSVQLTKTTNQYKDWFSDGKIIMPEIIKFKNGDYDEEPRVQFYKYDNRGNPLKLAKQDDIFISYIWDYNKRYPIAEVKNAGDSLAYTSFEADGFGGWTGIATAPTNRVETSPLNATDLATAVTGRFYYSATSFSLSAIAGTDKENYYVTYWTGNSSAYSVSHTVSGWPKLLKTLTINGKTWKLYEHKVSANNTITLTGTGDIDELRFYPEGSKMTTFTYSPFAGVSSQCDINHVITKYEYDDLGRLTLVRDQYKNILKKICYNYAGQPENCGVQLYYSVEKSDSFTRDSCSCGASGLPVTYTVADSTYTSSISQADADQLAQDDVDQNGQANADTTAAGCPPPVIYARMEYINMYTIAPSTYATPTIKFYCDSACTTPISVTNLEVSWFQDQIYCDENRPEIHTNPTHTITGTSYTIATNIAIISGGVNQSCYTRSYSIDTGTGYTAINP